MLSPLRPSSRYAIVGKSGTGKSNAAKQFLQGEVLRGTRLIAFDPFDEYSRAGHASAQVRLGPLLDSVTAEEFFRDPRRWFDAPRLALSVVPDEDDDEAARELEELIGLVKSAEDVALVLDEVGGYSFENAEAGRARKAMNTLATKGRHWGDSGCPCVFVSQRLVHIPKTARTQLGELLAFRQSDPEDLAALLALAKQRNFADEVERLPDGESKLWRDTNPKKEGES